MSWGKVFRRLQKSTHSIFLEDDIVVNQKGPTVEEAILKAQKEWECAKHRFNNVTDKDLIDYAIYAVEAAERRYMYLLKLAKRGDERLIHSDLNQALLQEVPKQREII